MVFRYMIAQRDWLSVHDRRPVGFRPRRPQEKRGCGAVLIKRDSNNQKNDEGSRSGPISAQIGDADGYLVSGRRGLGSTEVR